MIVQLEDTTPFTIATKVPKEMLSIDAEGNRLLVRINSSSLAVIQECPRKAYYQLYGKWRSESESPATLFGSAIHKALEVFYLGDPNERKLPKYEDLELMSYGHKVDGEETDLLLQSMRAFLNKAEPLQALPAEDKRSLQSGAWIMWNYFKTYLNDPYVAYVDEEGPFVERQFTFRLFQDDALAIDYFGQIDLVMMHSATKEIVVCDHKTSSIVGNDFYNRLKPNHQYTGYLMGAREVFGLKTNQFMVNCLEVKGKPKTSKGTAPHFPRQITTRDDEDFKEFKGAVVSAVNYYLANIKSDVWPMGHTNACASYGGCSYLSVCAAPRPMRFNILDAKFKRGDKDAIK